MCATLHKDQHTPLKMLAQQFIPKNINMLLFGQMKDLGRELLRVLFDEGCAIGRVLLNVQLGLDKILS